MNTYVKYHSIGCIHSSVKTIENMLIQPGGAMGIPGSIELFSKYQSVPQELNGFFSIKKIYWRNDQFRIDYMKLCTDSNDTHIQNSLFKWQFSYSQI